VKFVEESGKLAATKTAFGPRPLTAWEQYAQVLLVSNEFVFVD
jgi:hypothetical protein